LKRPDCWTKTLVGEKMRIAKKVVHGVYNTYTGGCRCDKCRNANNVYKRNRAAEKREVALMSAPPARETFVFKEGDVEWFANAACVGADVNLFFPFETNEQNPDYAPALFVCSGCSAQKECLDYATRTNQRDGVWGMTTPHQRRAQRRSLQAAR